MINNSPYILPNHRGNFLNQKMRSSDMLTTHSTRSIQNSIDMQNQ
jgi:hypothetical protein